MSLLDLRIQKHVIERMRRTGETYEQAKAALLASLPEPRKTEENEPQAAALERED